MKMDNGIKPVKRDKKEVDDDHPTKKKKIKHDSKDGVEPDSSSPTETSYKNPSNSVNFAKHLFQHFTDLTSENNDQRINAGVQLFLQLSKAKDVDVRSNELLYTLKRLVRGCGASTNASRIGFFTALVTLLKTYSAKELPTEQVFTIMLKELHVGSSVANKEDADAVVGRILVCGSILRSGRCDSASGEELKKIVDTILQSAHPRNYHYSLAYAFLIDMLETLKPKQFEAIVWPMLKTEICKPWNKQTMHTVHCLIAVQLKFPHIIDKKFLKANFGSKDFLNPESYKHLFRIFWEHGRKDQLTHAAVELFGVHAAKSKNLKEFWSMCVDAALKTPTKLLEMTTLKIATDILNHATTEQLNAMDLLGENFMKMLVASLKTMKQNPDETLKAFYQEFLDALVAFSIKMPNDSQKVDVIRRLILQPGTFNIEKYTQTRIVHQLINALQEEGVRNIYELYKNIFLGTYPRNIENPEEEWLHFEKLNAGYMLQHLLAHKAVQGGGTNYEWREEQLKFFLTAGIFHLSDKLDVCKRDAAGSFSTNFGEQCKKMFFASLQTKLLNLEKEKHLLLRLVLDCHNQMLHNTVAKCLRIVPFTGTIQTAWDSVIKTVNDATTGVSNKKMKKNVTSTSTKANISNTELVFHILLLTMGLQLLSEPEMAVPVIDDLLQCMKRINAKKDRSSTTKTTNDPNDELNWIEVLVDLLLHLLSKNVSALRQIVCAVFPHFCGKLNLNAVHQILSMLNMKDGNNPLSTDSELKEEESDGEDNSSKDDKTMNGHGIENGSANEDDKSDEDDDTSDDGDDDEDDDDDDDEDEDMEDETTDTDKLRNAISMALMQSSGQNNNNNNDDDDDMASVDLNDMTEEEGQRLDAALSLAFQTMKKSSNSSRGQIKKSKTYRVQSTTTMHFRIRVLDLIEIYLQHEISLIVALEILVALYDMIEYCSVDDELRPLLIKVEKVIGKLTSQKSTAYRIDDDMNEENVVNFLRLIIEKRTPPPAYDAINRSRKKCVAFLIQIAGKLCNAKATAVEELIVDYLREFIGQRNPIANITFFMEIFTLRWPGIWNVANTLAIQGLDKQVRAFRRIQTYELLSTIFKNYDLQRLDIDQAKKSFKDIESKIHAHILVISNVENDSLVMKISPKEFQTLLELLLTVHRANNRLQSNTSKLNNVVIFDAIQRIRQHVNMDTAQMYQRYCSTFKLNVLRIDNTTNHQIMTPQDNGTNNGHINTITNGDVKAHKQKKVKTPTIHDGTESSETNGKSSKKREASNAKDSRKLKKAKKLARLAEASRGFSEVGDE